MYRTIEELPYPPTSEETKPPKESTLRAWVGRRCGQLLIVAFYSRFGNGNNRWVCQCQCGQYVIRNASNLNRPGRVHSCTDCGVEPGSAPLKIVEQGGYTGAMASWRSMWQRCTEPADSNFHYYGGRGVTVCDAWRALDVFIDDMGKRPQGFTLDRKDPHGNYTPANCRWADAVTQANNKRVRAVPTARGLVKLLSSSHEFDFGDL